MMKSIYKLYNVGLTLSLLFSAIIALGQERIVIQDSIFSNVLQEFRPIEILLPKSYKDGTSEKYGVTYKLDGEWDKWLLPGSYDFVVGAKFVPDNIFVRIPNIYNKNGDTRFRDLLPSQKKENDPNPGGADNFRFFLKNELIPYINKKYSSNGENTLVGASLAGLFAVYTLLKDPHLFTSYVTVEPSMWSDNGYVNKLALEVFARFPNLENTTLWIAGRDGVDYKDMGIAQLDSILQAKAPKGLHWKTAAYPNETHYSAQYKGYYDGFKYIYSGYLKNIDLQPLNGILLKDVPFEIMVIQNNDSTAVRYTTDGSQPTTSSKKVSSSISLRGTAELTIKSFANQSKYNKSISGHFKTGEIVAANKRTKYINSGGLYYSLYEGLWNKLPEFKRLKPVKSEQIKKDFKVDKPSETANTAYLIKGLFEVPWEGYYVFYLESAEDAKIYVGNRLIIKRNEEMNNGKQSYVLPLGKGFHTLRVEFLQKKNGSKPNFKIYQDKLKVVDKWWVNEILSI